MKKSWKEQPSECTKKARALTCWRGGQRVGGSRKSKVSASAASGCLAPQSRRATVWQRRSLAGEGCNARLQSLTVVGCSRRGHNRGK